ncbi:MAG: hypothetical protein J6V15_07320 [Clostridia bacterium]|nr:hypothetical protein [Clostridia bacterium]
MKKRLYITVALVLCAGILVTGALLRGKPDDITPPDGTQDITPDNTQNVTPPDTTADDNKTPDTPTPPVQDDPPPPAQDDNKDKPDDNNASADNTKPDDAQKIDFEALRIENTKALQAYYAFITGGTTARSLYDGRDITFVQDITKQGTASIAKFALVDFGSDGILEVVFEHTNTAHSDAILFYEDGRVYVEYVTYRGILGLTYNGVISYSFNTTEGGTSVYAQMTLSAQKGEETTVMGRSEYISATDTNTYYLECDLIDGKTVVREETQVTKDEYEALFKKI